MYLLQMLQMAAIKVTVGVVVRITMNLYQIIQLTHLYLVDGVSHISTQHFPEM